MANEESQWNPDEENPEKFIIKFLKNMMRHQSMMANQLSSPPILKIVMIDNGFIVVTVDSRGRDVQTYYKDLFDVGTAVETFFRDQKYRITQAKEAESEG